MSNKKPGRKLKLPVETIRVLNPRPKTGLVKDNTALGDNTTVCPRTNDPPLKRS
jgi:hypothetical protein